MTNLVRAVKEFAHLNYKVDGWDFVVEAMTDKEILEAVGDAPTVAQAIDNVRRLVELWDGRRTDIEKTAF